MYDFDELWGVFEIFRFIIRWATIREILILIFCVEINIEAEMQLFF